MMNPATQPTELTGLPILSSQNQGWENILVEQFQHPPGEGNCHCSDEHTICLSLAPRPVRLLQVKGGKTYTGLYGKGHISITPARMPLFARWDAEDQYLQIRIASRFIQNVARETIDVNLDQLELLPEFRIRDPHLESIGLLLLAELKHESLGGKLYIESLANVLAVHLLRQYAAASSRPSIYEGGLPQRQVLQVLEYINEYLHQDIKLADLAALIGISQFHFSHLFKQSIGTTPYQYLLQQRIERAKQLLKQTDQSIMDIALMCGFNSHSHLSKQFRQLTGMTPKTYRDR
ncbi:helix-turn-helix transcriptional regulator [Oculatella sp. LEGE 06141]|uniref:helix-turn-helix domain-containing protein n=1 Tax=Oculatella sp. LEGE 06141 TaxID=1828648 RepID=UPI001880D0DF|nr:AraC family transcriptional regulator [Oculatella sp. LEGE 06141]MBE9179542.1 helix-turn-helix transcriptional regulator [Oculatella sp. LEGE 06141]